MSEAIANFEVLIRHGALKGRFEIDDYLEAYKAIHPSLHRYCQNEGVFDVEALLYVLARLPDRIHRVREILVQADVPDQLPEMRGIEEVVVPTRRRATFQIGEDRMVVVAREGATELLDLVTLLVAFVVEGYKIHNLLRNSTLLQDIRELVALRKEPNHVPDLAVSNRLLVRLAFDLGTTDDHLMVLGHYWGKDTLERLLALVDHPPRVVVRLHREYSMQVSMSRSKSWARRISEQIAERIPGQGPIHIISSNTHSTVNLLSPFPRLHRDTIMNWAASDPAHAVWLDSKLISRQDLLYYSMKGWMEKFPERNRERLESELSYGIFEVTDLDYVGVTAQVIDLARLPEDQMDGRLQLDTEQIKRERPIILNFNYAFGEQAGVVAEELFRQFSHRVASFGIMGKAGSLVGARGGLMLPSYLLREGSRDVYDIPGGNFLAEQPFEGIDQSTIHREGPMLTVLGTFLQNDGLLRDYQQEWKVIGLEMEGIPYLRSLHQCLKLGIVSPHLKVGVGYYASDSPLVPGESLAKALAVQGVNATYALNLAILNGILAGEPEA
jgi:hypothetical protein